MKRISAEYGRLSTTSKASIWFVVCNALQTGIGFLTLPFFTRLMSPEQYGALAVYNSWLAILSIFATLNVFSGVFNNGMVNFPLSRRAYLSSMHTLVAIGSVGCFLLVFACILLGFDFIKLPLGMVVAMFVQIFSAAVFSLWTAYQRYEYKYKVLLFMTALYSVAVTVLALVSVMVTEDDTQKALVRVAVGAVCSLVVAFFLWWRDARSSKTLVSFRYWTYALKFNIPLVPHYLAAVLLGQIDRIAISELVGSESAAMYSVALSLGLAMNLVVNALASSMTPWIYEKLKANDYTGIAAKFNNGVLVVCIAGLAISLIAPELMSIAAPSQYEGAVYVVPFIASSSIFLFLYSLFANFEFFYNANKFVSVASVAAALLKIGLNVVFIPMYGMYAAGWTTLACYIVFALAHTLFARWVCGRELGSDLSSVFRPLQIWTIALITSLLSVCSIMVYDSALIRYGIISVVVVGLLIFRNRISRVYARVGGGA